MRPLPKFYSVEDLKRDYERTGQGFWFAQSSMRFFGTRLTSNFRQLNERTFLFVTTERNPEGERRASIRLCTLKRDRKIFCGYRINIETVGDFHSLSLSQAVRRMKSLTLKELKNQEES